METKNVSKRYLALVVTTVAAAVAAMLAVPSVKEPDAPKPTRRSVVVERTAREIREPGSADEPADSREPAPTPDDTPEDTKKAAHDCVARLTAALAEKGHGSEETDRIEDALFRLLETTPEAAAASMARLCEPSCGERESSTLLSLMSAAGHEACQRAIAEYIDLGTATERCRTMAVIYIEQIVDRVEVPVAEIDAALDRQLDGRGQLSRTALCMIGSLGGHLREAAPVRFAAIARRVEEALDVAADMESLETALWAVGNMGGNTVPLGLERPLSHENDRIRSAAARALRRIPTKHARKTLERMAAADRSPRVRQAALETLLARHRTESKSDGLEDLLARVAETDESSELRQWAATRRAAL